MKKAMFAVLAGVFAIGAAQAQTVSANAADTPHFYVGAGIGAVKNSVSGDHKRTAKFFGGYEFDENWGVELGYSRLGKTSFYVPGMTDYTSAHIKSSSFYAAAKYKHALSERTSVYGKLGLSHGEYKYSSPAPWWNSKESNNGVYAAVGVEAKLTERVSLYMEYERNGKSARSGPKNGIFGAGVKFGF
jgi:opacity protein-like surface antigen